MTFLKYRKQSVVVMVMVMMMLGKMMVKHKVVMVNYWVHWISNYRVIILVGLLRVVVFRSL